MYIIYIKFSENLLILNIGAVVEASAPSPRDPAFNSCWGVFFFFYLFFFIKKINIVLKYFGDKTLIIVLIKTNIVLLFYSLP
jgi:hypothetical protein